MEKTDRWVGYFFLVLSAFVCLESQRMGLGTFFRPGAGFVPFCAGLLMGVFSIGLTFLTYKKGGEIKRTPGTSSVTGWLKVLVMAISMLLYAAVLERIGFVLSTFLIMIILLKIENVRWPAVFMTSVATALGSYLVFEVWLRSQLPRGYFGF